MDSVSDTWVPCSTLGPTAGNSAIITPNGAFTGARAFVMLSTQALFSTAADPFSYGIAQGSVP